MPQDFHVHFHTLFRNVPLAIVVGGVALSFTPAHASLIAQNDNEMTFSEGVTHTTMAHLNGAHPCDLIVSTTADRVVLDRTEPSFPRVLTDDGLSGPATADMPSALGPDAIVPPEAVFFGPPISVPVSPVPLPGSGWLFGLGAIVLGVGSRVRAAVARRANLRASG